MEEELGVRYKKSTQGHYLDSNSIGIVKYADDCAPRRRTYATNIVA